MRIQSSVLVILILSFNSFADPGYKQQSVPSDASAKTPTVVSTDTLKKTPAATTVTTKAEPTKKAGKNKQSVTFESLEQLNQLIEVGVPALALSLLEDEQKKREQFTADWYSFEYKRIVILSSLERWQQVVDRVRWLIETTIPGRNITSKIRLWFETQQVIARLQLKQSDLALDQLQKLLWHSSSKDRDPSLPVVWRRLVIRAYLQLQLDDDARKALVKYNRDYKSDANDID